MQKKIIYNGELVRFLNGLHCLVYQHYVMSCKVRVAFAGKREEDILWFMMCCHERGTQYSPHCPTLGTPNYCFCKDICCIAIVIRVSHWISSPLYAKSSYCWLLTIKNTQLSHNYKSFIIIFLTRRRFIFFL